VNEKKNEKGARQALLTVLTRAEKRPDWEQKYKTLKAGVTNSLKWLPGK